VTRKLTAAIALAAALLVLCPPPVAAGQPGAIKGRVVDNQGRPLTGAYLYVTSPSMLGIANFITSKRGRFAFPALTPGTYEVIVEMPGFKTITMEGIGVDSGATVTIQVKMETSDIEEEAISGKPGPGLDRESSRDAVVLDKDILERLPLGRDFTAILGLVPGLVFEAEVPGTRVASGGLPVTTNAFVLDGVDITHPVDRGTMGRINVDLIDQVVVEMSGQDVATGPAQGAVITVVQPPGSAAFQGSLSYSNASKGLAKSLWSEDEITEMGQAVVPSVVRDNDLSLTIGGPVLEEIAWLFANVRYRAQNQRAPFRYWTDPLGGRHFVYNVTDRDLSGLFKLSLSVADKYKGVIEFGFSGARQPVFGEEVDRFRPESASRAIDKDGTMLGRGDLSYIINQDTTIDLSIGYAKNERALLLNSAGGSKPQYYDVITKYNWGSGSLNDRESANRMRAGAKITRLQDRFLGLSHHLVAGGEYETTASFSSVWKADNLIYNYSAGSPYTFGQAISPSSGNEVGFGLIGFWIAPQSEGSLEVRREVKKLGFFLQDTMRIGGRVSLTAGLRFGRTESRFPSVNKGSSGNPVSSSLGSSLITPTLGYNLYGQFTLGQWEKPIVWTSLSPRLGMSIDILGNGRTVLKASFAKLPEDLGLGYSQDLAQIKPWKSHDFLWFDEDGNGVVGTSDTYVLQSYDFRVYKGEFFRQAVDPGLKAPVIEEWTAGVEQEIFRDFTLAARYVSRRHTNLIGNVLYDPSTWAHWGDVDEAPEGWWVPFTTVVPGVDGYADVPLSLNLRSTTAPRFFERIENVPELTAKYRSFELSARKRMSHNWQLFGSLVWNRATGTTSLASPWSAGNAPVLLTPNAFVNIAATDRLLQDRPFVARLAGTVRFRWDVYLSVLFKAQSGAPWARTVTILPPADWAAANGADPSPVTVYLESPGSRRFGSWKTLDARLEKEFQRAGRTKLSASVDVYNVLGNTYRTFDGNDGGTWSPDGPGLGPGTRVLSGTYGTYSPLWGTRVVRFNLSLKF
jgi:Carboxypeptidase regulatory-like domain